MNDRPLYIYRGNIFVNVGDILRVNVPENENGNGLYSIVEIEFNEKYENWSVKVEAIKVDGNPDKSYSSSDLDELYEQGNLNVFQKR